MSYKNGIGITLSIDADQLLATPLDTPDMQELDIIELSQSFNETVDTFYKLSDEGYATSKVVGLDPELGFTIKYDSADTTATSLYAKRFGVERTFPFEIADPITGETIAFNGEVTSISDTRNIENVVEFSFTLKLQGKPTITTV